MERWGGGGEAGVGGKETKLNEKVVGLQGEGGQNFVFPIKSSCPLLPHTQVLQPHSQALFYLIHRLSSTSFTGSLLPHSRALFSSYTGSSTSLTGSLLPHSQALFYLIHRLSSTLFTGSLLPHSQALFYLIHRLSSTSFKGCPHPHTCAFSSLIQRFF
jgi:hypothetical protein